MYKEVVRRPAALGALKPLVVVAEDNTEYQKDIVSALRKAFGDAVDVEVTDTYSVAVELLRKNAGRVCGVVTDVHYYREPLKHGVADDTEICGLGLIGEAKRIVLGVPVIIESDTDYSKEAGMLSADAFILKEEIKEKGPGLFKELFRQKLFEDLG